MAGKVQASVRGGMEEVKLALHQLGWFISVFFGDKVLRQVTPTGTTFPIIKQFLKHIRNPSIKS